MAYQPCSPLLAPKIRALFGGSPEFFGDALSTHAGSSVSLYMYRTGRTPFSRMVNCMVLLESCPPILEDGSLARSTSMCRAPPSSCLASGSSIFDDAETRLCAGVIPALKRSLGGREILSMQAQLPHYCTCKYRSDLRRPRGSRENLPRSPLRRAAAHLKSHTLRSIRPRP